MVKSRFDFKNAIHVVFLTIFIGWNITLRLDYNKRFFVCLFVRCCFCLCFWFCFSVLFCFTAGWGAWERCSTTCGVGTQTRVKECLHNDFTDVTCVGEQPKEEQSCSDGQCCEFYYSILRLKALMPITFSSPRAQPEVVYFLVSNESPYFSNCKSEISPSNSL